MTCSSCSAENPAEAKFCLECGKPLQMRCASCNTPLPARARFCLECGTPVGGQPARSEVAAVPPEPGAAEGTAEHRLVTVFFADLVGFTGLSESRDSEEVHELLSRYHETCRRIVGLYGGIVDKLVGDGVLAIWGVPAATEDDAERAVRAALELVGSVQALGEELGIRGLSARAGVLTGEAAVTQGADGQGMIAGDLVNTASRVQAAADSGLVYVGEATRRATEQTIIFESAGDFEFKGKTGLVPLWRAVRVISGVRGSLRSEGLEAPFTGRDRELRLLKELFHASAEEHKAHLVSVTGIAGIGKSRLAWEFFKYMDGLPQTTLWHRGRCLAYGEGVTYWALADMVRMRCRIAEDDGLDTAQAKLRTTVEDYISDPEERRYVEPALAHLLGLEERQSSDREALFGAWRLFFERLSDRDPVAMVFEDMQWADASLLDFVEYFLEWSRDHPLFVVTLARPELLERRATWGMGKRTLGALYLEPLPEQAMRELLNGLVPGLSEELRSRILGRAEGVPLYAVETVRMLLDRGALVQEGMVYRPLGPIETLEVPETLQALISARLDGLSREERRLIQDGAVVGKTFSRQALAAVSGLDEADLAPHLAGLVHKEVLSIQADPRSPEHGQYGFLQDLVRKVAYDTLSKRERKTRHLAAAAYLEQAYASEAEVVEVLASHYLSAYECDPEAEDAAAMRQRVASLLARAGERAATLAANDEAKHYFEQAAGLAGDSLQEAQLRERAGEMSLRLGRVEQAQDHFQGALSALEAAGESHHAARVSSRLGEIDWRMGRLDEALERMENAFRELRGERPDADVATLAAELGRLHALRGDVRTASEWIETSLEMAESLWLPEVLAQGLLTKGVIATFRARLEEALGLTRSALTLALEYEFSGAALRAFNNLADLLHHRDRFDEAAEQLELGLSLARRIGDRSWEHRLLGELSWSRALTGRWQEALACRDQIDEDSLERGGAPTVVLSVPELLLAMGRGEEARHLVQLYARNENSADQQDRTGYQAVKSLMLQADGKAADALALAEAVLASIEESGPATQQIKVAFAQALSAALALGDRDHLGDLLGRLDALPPGRLAPLLHAHAVLYRAQLAALDGDHRQAGAGFAAAAPLYRDLGARFWEARTLTAHAEWLVSIGRAGEATPLVAEARGIFTKLEAKPWLERVAALGVEDATPGVAEGVSG